MERVRVIELNAQGFSQPAIAKTTEIPRSTVQRVIQEWNIQQNLKADSRSGLEFRDKRHLYRLSDSDPYASLNEITAASGLNISPETAGRILRASGRQVRQQTTYISS